MAEVDIVCLMRHGLPARVADYDEFDASVSRESKTASHVPGL
jgi:hypothetical protein